MKGREKGVRRHNEDARTISSGNSTRTPDMLELRREGKGEVGGKRIENERS